MRRWAWLGLAALAVLPYLGSIRSPLLYDDRTLLDNRWLASEASPVSVFGHDYWFGTKHAGSDLYRPLTVLSLAWNLRAAGTREGFRAVNIALHAAVVLTLFWTLSALLPRPAAWTGAALFAVHPLASEAVLWVVGRAEIFSALFGLLAFALLLKGRIVPSTLAFFTALFFKESAAAWLPIGAAWVVLALPGERPPWRTGLVRAAPYGAALAAYLVVRGSVVGWARHAPPFLDNPLAHVDPATRAANAVLLFARYAGKMLVPGRLSIEYGYDQIPVTPLVPWGAALALAVAAAVAALTIVLHRKGHARAAFLVAFVPVAFAVTGNLAFPIGTIFAERLAYTPLLGACGLAGAALASIPKRGRVAAVLALLVLLGARTIVRGRDYRDLATLTAATAESSPRSVKALANAGRNRLRGGDAAGAQALLERAVALWPEYAGAWRLLSDAYAAQGDPARAAEAAARAQAADGATSGIDDPL